MCLCGKYIHVKKNGTTEKDQESGIGWKGKREKRFDKHLVVNS